MRSAREAFTHRGARLVTLRTRVQIQDLLDGATAHRAERHVVAREHDAIELRPIVPARFVVRALERTDAMCVWTLVQERRVVRFLLAEERVHLRLGSIRGADLSSALLDAFRVLLELLFRPR